MTMWVSRRSALLGGLGALFAVGAAVRASDQARAQGADHWYDLKDRDGAPLPNMRLPVELTSEIERLPGVFWTGAAQPDVTIIEVYDYNCPWCHATAQDLHALMADADDVRVGFMNNPILSPASAQAAKVELALLRTMGPQVAYDFYRAMFSRKGRADGAAALAAARVVMDGRRSETAEGKKNGATFADVQRAADDEKTVQALQAQMKLAASLGMSATPSFITGGVGIQGYPGPKTLGRIIAAMRDCEEPVCKG